MTKKFYYLVIIVLLITTYSCTKSVDSYLFSRPTHENNFVTTLDGELFAYTSMDTALSRADYYMRVKGYLVNYGEGQIVQYGHCWKEKSGANTTPNVSDKTLMTSFTTPIPAVGDSISFESNMNGLEPGTAYNVASYVIIETKSGNNTVRTVAYNPNVAEIETKPAIDEWFEQCANCPDGALQPSVAARFDALGFNYNEMLFYGTGVVGHGNGISNTISVYDPDKKAWEENIITIPDNLTNDKPNPGMMDGIGFAMKYKDKQLQDSTFSIFIGLGDHGGKGEYNDKSNFLLEYNMNTKEWKKRSKKFTNNRSGAVCFVIGKYAYIGTGEGPTTTHYDWFVFDPVAASDNTDIHLGEVDYERKGMYGLKNVPTINPRKGAIAFVINGIGYFGLGTNGKGKFYKDFYKFTPNKKDPTEGTWERLTDFEGEPRANAVAFAINDLGYVGTGDNLVSTVPGAKYFMEDEGKWKGKIFNDFYRFNPYTNTWRKVQDYTANKGQSTDPIDQRKNAIRPVTRAVGFSSQSRNIGFVGYGLVPMGSTQVKNPPNQVSGMSAQRDFWKYQPFEAGAK